MNGGLQDSEIVRLRQRMLAVARRYLPDAEAEDAVHDSWLKLMRRGVEGREDFEAQAIVAVRNRAIDIRRGQKPTAMPDDRTPDTSPTPEQRMIADENRRQIDAIIAQMPPTQQIVMTLRHADGLTNSEIARLTGLSETAIRQHLSRGRHRLLPRLERGQQPLLRPLVRKARQARESRPRHSPRTHRPSRLLRLCLQDKATPL